MKTQAQLLKQNAFTLLILLGIITLPPSTQAHPLVQYWQNRSAPTEGLILEPQVGFYSTQTNFDSEGTAVALPDGATVSRTYVDLNASYTFSNDWFVFGRASVTSNHLLGFGYVFPTSRQGLKISLQQDIQLPGSDPQKSDPSIDMTSGLFAEFPVSKKGLSIEAGFGYTYRTQQYSAALPFSLFLKQEPKNEGWIFAGGVRGQFSLNTDSTSTVPQGKSFLINAVNPSWVVAQGKFGYQTSAAFAVYSLLAAPMMGTNAPSGIQATIGFRFGFKGDHSPKADTQKQVTRRAVEFNQYDFESEISAVNDQLYLAKINRGFDDGIEKGQLFDIFEVEADTGAQRKSQNPVARAHVTHVKNDEAALTVLEYYRDQWIEQGFTAKRVVQ